MDEDPWVVQPPSAVQAGLRRRGRPPRTTTPVVLSSPPAWGAIA